MHGYYQLSATKRDRYTTRSLTLARPSLLPTANVKLQFLMIATVWMHTLAGTAAQGADRASCLLEAIESADEWSTVREIKARCAEEADAKRADQAQPGVLEQRIRAEELIVDRPFALTAHRPNYILPVTYNRTPNADAFRLIDPEQPVDSAEAQFQISFKFPIVREFLAPNNDLFFGFTTRAWWQLYNTDVSSPFRETDYEPEIFLRHYGGPTIGPIKVAGWDVGITHQSNGRSEPLSRSWNRINAGVGLEFGNFAALARLWYRIPEDEEDDDNPDLYKYLGYGDVRFIYQHDDQVVSAMFRPGTDEGAFELTWSMPIWQQLRLAVTYFDGYGESLIDYNHRSRRLGIGIALNDYLGLPSDAQ